MNRRHDDMRGALVIELLDPFAQVGLDDRDAARRYDVVVAGEVLEEQRFSGRGIFLATAVAQRLTAVVSGSLP
ncbi:hypothetical protein [Paraburkholderia ultramafica]|uniref:hypothetical protein n=1 Tax=Paraburkholderia ultramafica TaxID=1544867 RepID=UPI001582E52A